MELEKEIELLKEKIALLEKVKELQEMIKAGEKKQEPVYIPYYVPSYPLPTVTPHYPNYPTWTPEYPLITC